MLAPSELKAYLIYAQKHLNKFLEVQENLARAMENLPHDPKLKQEEKREAAKEKTKNQRDRNLGDHA